MPCKPVPQTGALQGQHWAQPVGTALVRRATLILSLALVLGSGFSPLPGQQLFRRTVSGMVYDSVSGRPLGGAEVYFATQVGQARSAGDGRFQIEGGLARDSVLVVRRIGYVLRTVVVTPSAALPVLDVGPVFLRPVATALDEILVEAEEVRRYPVLEGFYQRKYALAGLGHFFTRDMVQRTGAAGVVSVEVVTASAPIGGAG